MVAASRPARPPPATLSGSGTAAKARPSAGGQLLPLLLSQSLNVNNLRHAVFTWFVYTHVVRLWRHLRAYGVTPSMYQLYTYVSRTLLGFMLRIPALSRKVNRELDEATRGIEDKLIAVPPQESSIAHLNASLPEHGKDAAWVRDALSQLQALEVGSGKDSGDGQRVWKGGKLSGAVYHGGDDLSGVITDAIGKFIVANPLHPDVFPGVRRMEAEVVSMVLRMYNAPETGAGTTTSGGTESILMACKAAREWGRATRRVTKPEIVVSSSAHAAFHKAGDYFGIKVIVVEVDRVSRKVKLEQVKRAMNGNTVLLVGSAPAFGEGIIDDIPGLAALARRAGILCHVDCCLGSFLVPFLEKAGLPSEPFDFRVDGVTSISCDTHKYGFAPKGSSVVMYRSVALRRFQYYVQPDWTGGVYASPSIAGSRPGALIAGTWAALMSMGDEGYTQSCAEIVGAAKRIEEAIRTEIPQLVIMGKPLVSVVAFASAGRVNIYEVGDNMSKRGWHLNGLATEPPGVHIACTKLTVPVVEDFIADLKASCKRSSKPPAPGAMAQMYGLGSSSAIGPGLVKEMASRFLDILYLAK